MYFRASFGKKYAFISLQGFELLNYVDVLFDLIWAKLVINLFIYLKRKKEKKKPSNKKQSKILFSKPYHTPVKLSLEGMACFLYFPGDSKIKLGMRTTSLNHEISWALGLFSV